MYPTNLIVRLKIYRVIGHLKGTFRPVTRQRLRKRRTPIDMHVTSYWLYELARIGERDALQMRGTQVKLGSSSLRFTHQ